MKVYIVTLHGAELPLVAAKTSRPHLVRAGVARPRLYDLLDEAARRPVTLVLAGAGWGKTMAISGWAQERAGSVAWFSADRHDNDPQVFWSYLLAALRVADPSAAPGPVPADPAERAARLAAGLARLPRRTVLVIDDIHEIDDPDVLGELADLLRRPLPHLRLVLAGRTEPPLRLNRLRAAGQLAEIRTDQLAFDPAEAAEIVGRHGLTLSPGDMTVLVERTEGWATGLQLAAVFLAGRDGARTITDFAGDVRGVDDYLTEEVLADRTRRQRRFLLQTSICENLCAGLADAITQSAGSQRVLEQLEQDNDFVVRLGARPLWFRYHHLLRDVLGHRLRLETPAAVPGLHRRAARWHAANNSVLEALGHAVCAEDWAYVGRLATAQAGPLMVSAHRSALVKILRRVPADRLHSTPELLVCAALLLFHAGDYDSIPARLDAARALLHDRTGAAREPVEIMSHTLQLAADRATGDMPALLTTADRLLGLLAEARTVPAPAVAQNRAIALNNRGVALLWLGRPAEAEPELWAGANAARAAGVELAEINATGHLALLQILSGSVHEAAHLSDGALDLADQRGWRYALQTVAAHLARALVRLERQDLDGARQSLQDGLRAHHSDPEAAQRLVALGVQARLAAARGDLATARKSLSEARTDRISRVRAPAVDRWLALTESIVDLTAGRPDLVAERFPRAEPGCPEQLTLARAAYAQGDHRLAQERLATVAPADHDTAGRVEAGILAALLADARGHSVAAADLLSVAVTLAAGEGIRRPFVVLAEPRLDALLHRLVLLAPQDATLVADIVGGLPVTGRPEQPVESLSEREHEILRYLATMLTAAEIAADLGLSVNTVKAHMRAVYRKLGASRRTEAVTSARLSGLL